MFKLSKNMRRSLLFFSLAAIVCFVQATAAQSGRRINKNGDLPQQSEAMTEMKSAEKGSAGQTNEAPFRISSLVVVGEIQHNFLQYKTNSGDLALKECVRTLKSYAKSLSEIVKGGDEIDYAEAKERAKSETEAFVLWLGFAAKENGYGGVYIDFVQYAVLSPKTAKVVTRGQIQPKQTGVLSSGGVLNIPDVCRRSSELVQMKDGARQIAGILVRGGWLK